MEASDAGRAEECSEFELVLQELDKEMNLLLYAISHDLRAPLRSIDGFSQAVMEDYGDVLDDMGKDFLRRVKNAGQQLERYLEGLLQLSRETRGDLLPEYVELGPIAEGIVAELRERDPGRQVEFRVEEGVQGVPGLADRRLVRVLLEKLLENAWKFTSGNIHARVKFGMVKEENRPVYFVADNGVGFDEKYAGPRLFGAFQRMHSDEEYEGLGMGLATARRIINRHRGRIWAKSEVGEGTTVYFILPAKV